MRIPNDTRFPHTPTGIKVCLLFQRRFTAVAHKIAIELKKNHGIEQFCGYVYLRSSEKFLHEQKDIVYGELLVDEDIFDKSRDEKVDWNYLEELEKELGMPNLWPYVCVDRVIRYGLGVREYPHDASPYTHEDMARFLQRAAREITAFLEREKPDVIYFPAVSALGNMLLFYIAKKKGIAVLTGAETRIEGGYAFSETYKAFSWAEEKFRKITEGEKSPKESAAQTYLKEYRAKPRTYLYAMESFKNSGERMKAFEWLSPRKLTRSARWLSERFVRAFFQPYDYMDQPPWWFLLDATKRKFRLMRGYDDLYDAYDGHEKFAYYPLHLEPEMAMLLLAPRWTDQIYLIKQIAESLPFAFKLYVKEHPVMVGFRTRGYYRELKKIPNVKLIHPNHNSHEIIKDAKLILTETGTAGWEALLLKKPVITFGDVYYNALSAVKKCTDLEKLSMLVKEQLEHFKWSEQELINFISALLEDSVNIKLHELWEKGLEKEAGQKSIAQFAGLLMRKIRLPAKAQ